MLKKARRLVGIVSPSSSSSRAKQPVVLSIEKAALRKQAQVFEVANPEAEASGKLAQNTQRPFELTGAWKLFEEVGLKTAALIQKNARQLRNA